MQERPVSLPPRAWRAAVLLADCRRVLPVMVQRRRWRDGLIRHRPKLLLAADHAADPRICFQDFLRNLTN
jgi:hypothetical protein